MGNLRQAATDGAHRIVTDGVNGFAWPVELVDPDGVTYEIEALTNDIAELIDAQTNTAFAGRHASVVLSRQALMEFGIDDVEGIREEDQRPWLVRFAPTGGEQRTFKIFHVEPDNQMGLITCHVETYDVG